MANVWLKLVEIYSNRRREKKKYSESYILIMRESMKSFGIAVIASYMDSQLACIDCPCFNYTRVIYNTTYKTATESGVFLQSLYKSLVCDGFCRCTDNVKFAPFHVFQTN